jgi:hypothetical protein
VSDGTDAVTATPEEADALASVGLINIPEQTAGDAVVSEPFSIEDVKETLEEMRRPEPV